MRGERNLDALIAGMRPRLVDGEFVFATVPTGDAWPAGVEPVMVFRESEGTTLVCERAAAESHGLRSTFPCRMITLDVHSALDAVGFMSAITSELARAGIGVNPVSAYFHDHLFVPLDRAMEAIERLRAMALARPKPQA